MNKSPRSKLRNNNDVPIDSAMVDLNTSSTTYLTSLPTATLSPDISFSPGNVLPFFYDNLMFVKNEFEDQFSYSLL